MSAGVFCPRPVCLWVSIGTRNQSLLLVPVLGANPVDSEMLRTVWHGVRYQKQVPKKTQKREPKTCQIRYQNEAQNRDELFADSFSMSTMWPNGQ